MASDNKLRRTMEPTTLDLERFLPYRLSVLSNTVSAAIAQTYSSRYGLSIPEWRVMAVLGRFPEISAAEVAERTAMDKVAVSRAVSRLLASSRIRRSFANADRRRSILDLSPAGKRLYQRIAPMLLEYEDALLSALNPAERQQLDAILQRLADQAVRLERPDSA
ncbi:MAG: MarR family winged helix-turn-helix transcriptional regulator [Gammaproteobacteria bacterium]